MTQQLWPGGGRTVSFDVLGLPRPQGSLKAFVTKNGKVATTYPKTGYEWRGLVTHAAVPFVEPPLTGALQVKIIFDLPHIQGHYSTAKGKTHLVKPNAPKLPTVAPDIDKLARSVLDSLTDAGLWHDDAQVAHLVATKRYTTGPPGAHITVAEIKEDT